MTRVDG